MAGKEVLENNGEIKLRIRSALERGGHYIVLNTHSCTQQQIDTNPSRLSCLRIATPTDIDDTQTPPTKPWMSLEPRVKQEAHDRRPRLHGAHLSRTSQVLAIV